MQHLKVIDRDSTIAGLVSNVDVSWLVRTIHGANMLEASNAKTATFHYDTPSSTSGHNANPADFANLYHVHLTSSHFFSQEL